MEKTNINRLLRVFIPFIIMVMTQNTLLLLFGRAGMSGTLPSLTAFIVSSAVAAFIFHLQTHPEDKDTGSRRVCGCAKGVMYFFFTTALLIVAMYGVSLVLTNYTAAEVEISPVYLVSILVIHPLIEEHLFRGLFYGELRKMNPMFGIIAQAIMFAIIHGSVDSMVYALFSGVLLGIAAEKTGRLWVPYAAHVFINARSLIYLTWLSNADTIRERIDITLVALGAVSLLILLWMRGRSAIDIETPETDCGEILNEEDDNGQE